MDASFAYDDGSYCVGDANPVPTITGDTTGSFTSSTGLAIDASSGVIDIASSNVGDYLVSYIVGNSNCADTVTQSIRIINVEPGFNFNGDSSFCQNGIDPTPVVTAAAGGVFVVPNGLSMDTITGIIDVSSSTPGNYTVGYNPPLLGQLGQDIDGEAANDLSGNALATNGTGNRVVIGAYGNDGNGSSAGHVRVYEWNGSNWAQLGQDVDGELQADFFGWDVDMNTSGDRIVVGATRNDGNGSSSGHARVFQWSGTSWGQVGSDIDGELTGDQSGYAVSISSSGNTVAVGATRNDGNGSSSGHVRVYEWDGTVWNQQGQDINGDNGGDQLGYAVDLNASGNRLVVGAPFNDDVDFDAGHTKAFEWNGSTWVQMGANMEGAMFDDKMGTAVAMNAIGDRLITGAPLFDQGYVSIYAWDGSAWNQLGASIQGEASGDAFGHSVAISASGDRIVVGATNNEGTGNYEGHARIFDWNGSTLSLIHI